MRTIQIKITEADAAKYQLSDKEEILFAELLAKINLEYARIVLKEANQIAQHNGLLSLTMEEINAEINATRQDAKNNS